VTPVSAHGYLLRSIPEDHAVLERAPARLQYWFSEPLEPEFSSLVVRDQAGNALATGGLSPDNDSLLTVRLPRALPEGAYIVDMRLAFASDGHVVAQSRVFFVGEAVGGVSGQVASDQADILEAIWRTLTLSSTLLLFGVFTLYSGVLVPAWGSSDFRAGLLPPRVMRRLSLVIAGSIIVAIIGNVLALLQQSMVFFNADLSQVISGQLWTAVRVGTRFGDLWNARMVLLALVAGAYGFSLYFRDEQPETVRPFWTASAWAMALLLATFSAGSHAAGSLLWPWIGIIVDWLHILAVGFWTGELVALVLVLPPALHPLQGEARRLALLAALSRFSRLAVACVVLVISTGIYSALNWIYTPSELTDTTYGGALTLKVLLVAGLLVVGLAHHITLHPQRYTRWIQTFKPLIQRLQSFLPTLRLEAIFILLVLASVGYLSATPVPTPDFIQQSIPPPSAEQSVGDLTVKTTLTPGGPGANTYDIFITRDGQPVDGLDVQVQIASPTRDKRSGWLRAEDADSGLYVAAGAEIDRDGEWWSLVDITQADGTTQRAAFDWNISAEAAVIQSRNPGLLNILALLGVLATIGWLLYPSGQRLYHTLDLRPATVTVAVSATLATVLLSVMGVLVIQSTQAQYDATLNPAPTIVNEVLPDQASLERGQTLYDASCVGWTFSSIKELIQPRSRDENVFTAVRDGGRNLPACATLTDAQRWDIVNYLRTLKS
jgi:copper transport protein